jgi:hypothetical protein
VGHVAGYEHDGEIFGCPGKCGIFDMLFSRFVIPVKFARGREWRVRADVDIWSQEERDNREKEQ